MKSFYEIIEIIGGERSKFTLENRIFNVACIVISLLAIMATVINLILQVHVALTLMTTVSSVIFALFFYFTRYKERFDSLYLPFLFLINIIAGILWFLNGGTHGPTAFGYMLLVTIAIIIGKRRDQFFLVALIMAMLFFLFFIEFKYPLSIIGYEDEKTRFFDYTSTLLIFIFLTSIIVRALKKNYDDERVSAESIKNELANSLNYASKIQKALLISPKEINSYFNDAFVLNKPKAIVSGDFYWLKRIGNKKILVVADSTGSGVSVALMSILGISMLNEIVNSNPNIEANQILNLLRTKLSESLRTDGSVEAVKYDFDISICIFDDMNNKMQFAGAGNPIYFMRDNKLERIDAERIPINFNDLDVQYSKQEIEIQKNDRFYLFTDGYIDQFGGPNQKKFMAKQFKELLLSIHESTMANQQKKLQEAFENWKGDNNEQVDDVLVIGIKI